jgi:hypothetical protein
LAVSATCCRHGLFDAFVREVVITYVLVIMREVTLQSISTFVRTEYPCGVAESSHNKQVSGAIQCLQQTSKQKRDREFQQ